jgi:hypothetical protein
VASALIPAPLPLVKLAMAALLKGNTVLDPLIRIGLAGWGWAWTGLSGSCRAKIPTSGIQALIGGATTAARETGPLEFAPATDPFR